MKTTLLIAGVVLIAATSASAGEYSQVWFNYHEVSVGDTWEETITIRDDSLWVGNILIDEVKEEPRTLGSWEQMGIDLQGYLGDEKDAARRSELAVAWLKKNAATLIIGDPIVIRPGVLQVQREDGCSRMNVRWYEDVHYDPRASLEERKEFILRALSDGAWLIVIDDSTRSSWRLINPVNVPKTINQLNKIRAGVPDVLLELQDTGITAEWVAELRKED